MVGEDAGPTAPALHCLVLHVALAAHEVHGMPVPVLPQVVRVWLVPREGGVQLRRAVRERRARGLRERGGGCGPAAVSEVKHHGYEREERPRARCEREPGGVVGVMTSGALWRWRARLTIAD